MVGRSYGNYIKRKIGEALLINELKPSLNKQDNNQWQKLWEKLLFGQFCVSLPLTPLNNIEKQWAKLASVNVMGSQHCIGGKGEF